MIKSRAVLAGCLLAFAGVAGAAVTVTPAVVSDYDFRGISQNKKDPAFQLGVNWTQDSGFYAGLWTSNVDFGTDKPDIEVDVFAGFTGGDASKTFGYDIGINTYNYPGAAADNYTEIYASISKGMFMGKVWFSPNVFGTTWWYTEGDATVPLPMGFSFLAHVGYSFGNYWKDGLGEYFDWSVGLSRSFGPISGFVKYIDGSDLPDLDGIPGVNTDVFSTDKKVVVGISTTLPWAKK